MTDIAPAPDPKVEAFRQWQAEQAAEGTPVAVTALAWVLAANPSCILASVWLGDDDISVPEDLLPAAASMVDDLARLGFAFVPRRMTHEDAIAAGAAAYMKASGWDIDNPRDYEFAVDAATIVINTLAAAAVQVPDAVEQLRTAVANPGRRPDHHGEVMARHRREWPTLWRAIDQLTARP